MLQESIACVITLFLYTSISILSTFHAKSRLTLKGDQGQTMLKELKEDQGQTMLKEDQGQTVLKELKEDQGQTLLKEDQGQTMLNEPGTWKLERQHFWQQAEHTNVSF